MEIEEGDLVIVCTQYLGRVARRIELGPRDEYVVVMMEESCIWKIGDRVSFDKNELELFKKD